VALTGSGETLLCPDLPDILRQLKTHGVEAAFVSNEQLLNRIVAELLISFDAATKQTYETIRTGGRWERLLAGVRVLNAVKEARNSDRPAVTGLHRPDVARRLGTMEALASGFRIDFDIGGVVGGWHLTALRVTDGRGRTFDICHRAIRYGSVDSVQFQVVDRLQVRFGGIEVSVTDDGEPGEAVAQQYVTLQEF